MGVTGRWQIEGRTLVSDAADISIRYVGSVENVTTYSPAFVTAFAALLAQRAARAITQKEDTVKMLLAEAKDSIKAARSIDEREGAPTRYISQALLRDRW